MRTLTLLLILTALLAPAATAADDEEARRILVVATSHDTLGDTGKPTGAWLAEVAHPWVHFVDAGFQPVLASPTGGEVPIDPRSMKLDDEINQRFWRDLGGETIVATSRPLAEVESDGFVAVFYAGGHGTMWDFPGNPEIQRITAAIHRRDGGVVAAVCHGPAALVDVPLADGSQLVAGKRVAAFTNSEEEAVGLTEAVPFLLVDRLREQGATVVTKPDWELNVVVDGRLVTGQNPGSATAIAEAVTGLLTD